MDTYYMKGSITDRGGVLPIHTQRPGHDGQLQRKHFQRMQEKMSDSEESDTDTDDFDIDGSSAILNLNPVHGQSVALWSYLKYDNIAIFPPANDLMNRVVGYAQEHLGFRQFEHKLMLLSPGQLSPVDLKTIYSIRPGSVIMVLPEGNIHVTIDINQLKTSFTLTVDLTMTVQKIKSYIRRRKGIPVERQEILYANKALQNDKRLFEYRVKKRSTLHVMLQAHFDLLINVETFWGKSYRFYLDPCSTGMDIVFAVFNRCFSAYGPEDAGLHELYVPIHILVLQYQNKLVNSDFCIAYLGIRSGEKLLLTTVGHQNHMKLETVNVVTESAEKYSITVSEYDRWSILAFMLHGLTNVPVDLIRLYIDGKRIDFSATIGDIEEHEIILMNVVMTHIDSDLVFGVPLKISIGNGIIENIRFSATRTVRQIKKKLERMGVPNATLYELTIGNQKLPNSSKICDLVFDLKIPLVLKLETYPVFAHAPDGVIYKTYLKVTQTLRNFKHKIELKTGYTLKSSRLMIAGEELQANSKSILYDLGVSCRNSIFFKHSYDMQAFFILGNSWVEKIQIPSKPASTDVRNAVWNARKLPEGSLNCVLTALYWLVTPKLTRTNRAYRKMKIGKRMPVAKGTMYEVKKNKKAQYLEKDLLAKQKARVSYSSPNPGDKISWPRTSSKVRHYIKTDNLPKFEPDQYLNHADTLEAEQQENQYNRLPDIYDPPHSTIPKWMKNLQTKHKINRLIMADVESGPDGMASVHPSRSQPMRKRHPRISEVNEVPDNLRYPHMTYKANHKNTFDKPNRFKYDHQHFDFVESEYSNEEPSELKYPKNFLPKV